MRATTIDMVNMLQIPGILLGGIHFTSKKKLCW